MDEAEENKLFVGGISWETTDDILKEHFGKYGTVVGSKVMADPNTGSPRGFAFVTFSESSAVNGALQDSHQILCRTVEVKRAFPRNGQQSLQQQLVGSSRSSSRSNGTSDEQLRNKKIFVGGLSAKVTEEGFKKYFERFGRITDVVVMHDNMTHRPKGFGFITFDSEDSVKEVMQYNFHELAGKVVEVKRAIPKDGISSNGNGYDGRLVCGVGPNFNSYTPYNPRFGYYPSGDCNFTWSYGTGTFYRGYLSSGLGISYGLPPYARMYPWSPSMPVVGGIFLPHGNAAPFYPTYLNGGPGVIGWTVNGNNGTPGTGFSGRSAQLGGVGVQSAAEPTHSKPDNVDDANSLGSARDRPTLDSKQSEQANEKSCPATNSS